MKSGNLNFLEPSGPLRACNGTALPLQSKHDYIYYSYRRYNYMFRPLYWPSSGCTPSCYKVTIQYTKCLLLIARSRSHNFVTWTNINSSGTDTKCSRVVLLSTLLSRAFCISTTRINVSQCYKIL